MTGESTILRADERRRLAAAVRAWDTADYVGVRALTALSDEGPERLGRFTAMGRQFVVDVRRRVRERGAEAMLGEAASAAERVLETATDQIVERGPREVTMSAVARLARVPRRSLYNMHAARGELVDASRRRGQTVWRARFEQRVLAAAEEAEPRLYAIVDAIDEWVLSPRFARDRALLARPSFTTERSADDLRDHFAEVERFATTLARDAGLSAVAEFGALVTTLVAGSAAWHERREASRATSVAMIQRLVAQR